MGHGVSSRWRKDTYDLVFRLYSLQNQVSNGRFVGQVPKLRSINGRAVVRWKTKRKHEWEKRNRTRAEETGEAADAEQKEEER